MTPLEALLTYLISLAANERSNTIASGRLCELKDQLHHATEMEEALDSTGTFRDQVSATCTRLARNLGRFEISADEQPVWNLLSDEVFQAEVADWLEAGPIQQGADARARLLRTLEAALRRSGAEEERLSAFKERYLELLDAAVQSNPRLAAWRQQLVSEHLRKLAEEQAAVYSRQDQEAALAEYREKALKQWDIVDLWWNGTTVQEPSATQMKADLGDAITKIISLSVLRKALLDEVHNYLVNKYGLPATQVHVGIY